MYNFLVLAAFTTRSQNFGGLILPYGYSVCIWESENACKSINIKSPCSLLKFSSIGDCFFWFRHEVPEDQVDALKTQLLEQIVSHALGPRMITTRLCVAVSLLPSPPSPSSSLSPCHSLLQFLSSLHLHSMRCLTNGRHQWKPSSLLSRKKISIISR